MYYAYIAACTCDAPRRRRRIGPLVMLFRSGSCHFMDAFRIYYSWCYIQYSWLSCVRARAVRGRVPGLRARGAPLAGRPGPGRGGG